MKIRYLFLPLLLSFYTASYGQNPYKADQIILQFTADATQTERLVLINQLGTMLQDEDGDPAYIDDLVLIQVSEFPVAVNGVHYQDEIELTGGIHDNHARLDGSGLNYKIQQPLTEFDTPLGSSIMSDYSPLTPICEANYPGGPLQADDFSDYQAEAVTVAILDSGLDPYYDFINQYLAGAVDVTLDDDGVGQIRRQVPYDFENPFALDVQSHGTAVTGIIAGLANRANVPAAALKIIPIKCFGDEGEGELFNMLQALRVARDLGVDVMNLSWSYFSENTSSLDLMRTRINQLSNEDGVLLVTSAGNNGKNIDDVSIAPASFTNAENLLTVGGTSLACNGTLAGFSNFGRSVDLAAPSESLTVPGVGGYWSTEAAGTSFAAPIVTAAAIQTWLCSARERLEAGLPTNPNSNEYPVREILLNILVSSTELELLGIPGVVSFTGVCNYTEQKSKPMPSSTTDRTTEEAEGQLHVRDSDLSAFPNPFFTQLRLSVAPDEAIERLHLYGINGERILAETYADPSPTMLIKLKELPAGVYSLQVYTNRKTYVHKVVKQ